MGISNDIGVKILLPGNWGRTRGVVIGGGDVENSKGLCVAVLLRTVQTNPKERVQLL